MGLPPFKSILIFFLKELIEALPFLIIVFTLSIAFAEAQIPRNPNKTDAGGKRQGKWTILFDKDWNPVADTSAVMYYRTINYLDDKPSGIVQDYYRNGCLQFTGNMVEDRPKEILTGRITWFNQDGNREVEALFDNGLIKGTRTLFYSDGSIISEPWTSLNEQGQLFYKEGKLNEALIHFEKALKLAKYESDKLYIHYTMSLNNLAFLYNEMANYSKAEPLYLEALEIQTLLMGKKHPGYATTLDNLAALYYAMGNYSKAEPLYLEAKEIRAKTLGKEDPYYAKSLNNLAVLYSSMGNYSKAEGLYLEAWEIQKLLGKDHADYSLSLSNLASLYINVGDYSKAEPLYLEAKEIKARVLGKEHPDYATTINNLALLYKIMGNYSKAESLYLEAKEIRATALGKAHPDYAATLSSLAALYCDKKDYSKAEPLLLEAMEIRRKSFGKENPDYATSLSNLALLYGDMGDYSKAEPLCLEAKEIRARVLGKEHPDYTNSLNNLAVLYKGMHNYPKAETLLLEAKEIRTRVLGNQHPDYAVSLNNLAALYDMMGNYSKAEPLYLESIALKLQHIIRYFPSLSEGEKQDYVALNRTYFSNFEIFCLDRYPQNPAIVGDLYNLMLATKGLLFDASNKVRLHILNSKNQTLIDHFNLWQSKRDFLAKVYKMSLHEKQQTGIEENKLEDEANMLEKELNLQSGLFANVIDAKQYTWEDIRQKLKRGEAAIEMVRTYKTNQTGYSPAYAALIVTPQTISHPDIVLLENGTDLENKFTKYYRNAVRQKIKDEISYNQYWKPIADKIQGARKIYFSADGAYNQINLNTLYNPSTGRYVMDEVEVQVVTSTKDLVTGSRISRTEMKDVTLFGYPNYNTDHSSVTDSTNRSINKSVATTEEIAKDTAQHMFQGEKISDLPGTRLEVETIEALLKKKNIAMHEYMFDKATEEQIKKLNNPQVLHIATHGFFLSDLPPPKENERGLAGMETKKIFENPLLRSGLLFAGARNAFAQSLQTNGAAEDGILSAYEVVSLDLGQTDLVVMSACETGLGVTSNGEGVYGLQRAFQVAGAKSVLMSLWKVSDEATQQLMVMFYKKWLKGKSPREAFRQAQFSLRRKYPDPYYWGAFVMVGN